MFESAQHTSLRTDFSVDSRSASKYLSTPAFMTASVYSSLPVTMLPIERKAATPIATLEWLKRVTSRPTMPVFRRRGIAFAPESEMYEIAQQQSIRISSFSFSIAVLHITSMHDEKSSNCGAGFPRHRFEIVHATFLTRDVSF